MSTSDIIFVHLNFKLFQQINKAIVLNTKKTNEIVLKTLLRNENFYIYYVIIVNIIIYYVLCYYVYYSV